MTTVELEEEVRWFLTWHMNPERIASLVNMSSTAISKRFLRAGISDLYTMFNYTPSQYNKEVRNQRDRKRRSRKAA